MPPSKTFGERVRERRDALGLTQVGLAVACGYGIRTVLAWENNQRDPRHLDDIKRVAEVLRTTPEWLAFGVGAPEGDGAAA